MPKKHHQRLYTKPPSTAPTTLGSSSFVRSHSQAPTQSQPQSNQSVNELLHHLRISQARASPASTSGGAGQPRTHHPSVAALIGPDPDPLPLRPRSRIIGSRALPRTTSGPPPPRSWLRCSNSSGAGTGSGGRRSEMAQSLARLRFNQGGKQLEKMYRLPGMVKVGGNSLMHYALVTIARNWEWIMVYEKYYLPTLRPSLKALLGAYIIAYGDGSGMSREGLKVLYPPQEKRKKKKKRTSEKVDGSDGNDGEDSEIIAEGVGIMQGLESWDMISSDSDDADQDPANLKGTTHLDLSYSLGTITTTLNDNRNFSLKNLERFLFSGHTLPPPPDSDTNSPSQSTAIALSSSPRLHLPSLTHLSLAYPTNLPASSLWSRSTPHNLPHILSHIPTLTHLSLAGWPGPPSHYSLDQKARAIQRLSKSTYCLKWLDLSDWDSDVFQAIFLGEIWKVLWDGVWGGYWRAVETVVWCGSGGLALAECGSGDGESGEGSDRTTVDHLRLLLAGDCESRVSRIRKTVEGGGRARLRVVVMVDQDRGTYEVDD